MCVAAPIYAKRAGVVKGEVEAPEDIVLEDLDGEETGPAGIPEFWLGVLRANEVTAAQVKSSPPPKLPIAPSLSLIASQIMILCAIQLCLAFRPDAI